MNFFHLIFPCAKIFFVLRPSPTPPISFLMVRPLVDKLHLVGEKCALEQTTVGGKATPVGIKVNIKTK